MSMTRRDALASGAAFTVTALASSTASAAPAWEARSNMDAVAYQAKFDQMTAAGFRPVVVDGYSVGGQTQFAAIWRKIGGPAWAARHGLDGASYQQVFNQLTSQGYRPRRVSVYQDGGVKYAAIFDQSPGNGWVARHGLNQNDFQAAFDQLVSQGLRLTDIGVCGSFMSGATYAGIWEPSGGQPWESRSGLDADAYQQKFDQMTAQGFRPRQVRGYNLAGQPYFCAIWVKGGGNSAWEAHHNFTTAQFQQKFDQMNAQGYWLTDVSGYDLGGQAGFAGIWEKAP